jgi:hypothetical protein
MVARNSGTPRKPPNDATRESRVRTVFARTADSVSEDDGCLSTIVTSNYTATGS